MSLPELESVLDWAAAEGWNPGLQDAASFYAADPDGFLLGTLEGQAVASIFAVRYGAGFGFIGGYIVRPEFRGKGLGMAIWQAGMAHLAGRNVGLDGVLAQQANYARSGFKLAHRNVRYEGRGSNMPQHDWVLPLGPQHIAELLDYDRAFFPGDRTQFMRRWLQQDGSVTLGVHDGGVLKGYGVLRPCRAGFKIGPLCTESPAVADELMHALRGRVPLDEPVFLDVPEPNAAAVALAARHGMQVCFETARMYTGADPGLPLERQFGITTFELG
ncbi:GNAT family N-acetyltransferase [Pseudoduganella violaceinigra]|uniref:GNAT family N-acetyltransferase n=1 Tax=Pseudoduganella violaceinigra TaxID=246602 RepID=UPI0003F9F239|nr:GNAT family N-acetyltransferase [Pseudoduganella violaceinigra]